MHFIQTRNIEKFQAYRKIGILMTVCLLAGICHAQQIRISGKVLEASTKQACSCRPLS